MTATRVADVIVPEVFNPYVMNRTAELSALYQSGIIASDPELNRLASAGGTLINMPYFNDLTGASEVLSDTTPLSVNKITTGKCVARLHLRGKAWGSNDLAKALAGADPMGAIGDLVADYWARDMQSVLISTLKGVFASTTMAAEHVLNIAIADGNAATAANKISADAVIDACTLLGDSADKFTAIAMHSTVYAQLQKQNLIVYIPNARGEVVIPTYLGKRVIKDDNCPRVAGGTSGYKYTTYLFGQGAIGYGVGNVPVPTETDRYSLAGEDILINRQAYLIHPNGVRWTETSVAGLAPTNAELETASNWSRVYERKNVPLVALITNG